METEVTIDRSPEELFAFLRNFENLPRLMQHVESVQCLDGYRARWRVRRSNDKHLEWEAEVINEHPNELIAWRSLEGSDVRHAGSIRFRPAVDGRGTEVKLALEYEAGKITNLIAKAFTQSPERQIREDLQQFKEIMESGDISTVEGDPGRRSNSGMT